jgi:hypothetical protein
MGPTSNSLMSLLTLRPPKRIQSLSKAIELAKRPDNDSEVTFRLFTRRLFA